MSNYPEKSNIAEIQSPDPKNKESNFFYSFGLMDKDRNEALNTIYAFCRKTDDIVDNENLTVEDKYLNLKQWRDEFDKAVLNKKTGNNLLDKVIKVIGKYGINHEPFYDLIRGMEMDLRKNRYNTFSELAEYCFKVASNVGLMCIEIFGYKNNKTRNYAINLGIALQLTNILRDIKTDAGRGRIYIPLEDMRRFNYTETDLFESRYNDEFIRLMEFQCGRARYFYDEAIKSLAPEDKKRMIAARIMEKIYSNILKKIEKKHYNIFDKEIRLSKARKLLITFGIYLRYKIPGVGEEKSLAFGIK